MPVGAEGELQASQKTAGQERGGRGARRQEGCVIVEELLDLSEPPSLTRRRRKLSIPGTGDSADCVIASNFSLPSTPRTPHSPVLSLMSYLMDLHSCVVKQERDFYHLQFADREMV